MRCAFAVLTPLLLALAGVADAQPTPTPNPIYVCSGHLVGARGLRDYTNNYLQDVAKCALERLNGKSCEIKEDDDEDLLKEVKKCTPEAIHAICPLGGNTEPKLAEALVGASPTSVKSQLRAILDDVFFTELNESCPRPTGAVSSAARQCADKLVKAIVGQETVERVAQCYFSCERPRLNQSGLEFCIDDLLGEPVKDDLIECEEKKLEALELIEDRCTAEVIRELGCPLGAESVGELQQRLRERITTFARELNMGIFHSPCQGSLPGGPGEPEPVWVTLRPKGIRKQLSCGQTIDAAFMEGNKEVVFEGDLDCSGAKPPEDGGPINGILVAKRNIVLSGVVGKKWRIRGPQRSSLRTGVGIKLLPGVTHVQIKNFKAIENWGIGIEDSEEGNNKKLRIVKTTVRRNVIAGLRIRSPKAIIDEVVADKNGIGMDLSGEGIRVKNRTEAKNSAYPPKVGIRLSGVDKNRNGLIVKISSGPSKPIVVEGNEGAGILIAEGPHSIIQAHIQKNPGPGILIEPFGYGSRIDSNSIKFNGDGVVVRGNFNTIRSNTAEDNFGDGFVVETAEDENGNVIGGYFNALINNDSGKKSDRGNLGAGYRVGGIGTQVESNEAEANLGSGFVVTGTTSMFKGNNAEGNEEHGFDFQSSGHAIQDCNADANGGHQWTFVAGEIDKGGNKASGKTIRIPEESGYCDKQTDCPLPR
ncbi:MAG TPA: right-handed parallel beta-helix repeat-containing protein [Candidatus Binatia bacterium]